MTHNQDTEKCCEKCIVLPHKWFGSPKQGMIKINSGHVGCSNTECACHTQPKGCEHTNTPFECNFCLYLHKPPKESWEEKFERRLETRGGNGFFWSNGNLNPDALRSFIRQTISRERDEFIKELVWEIENTKIAGGPRGRELDELISPSIHAHNHVKEEDIKLLRAHLTKNKS